MAKPSKLKEVLMRALFEKKRILRIDMPGGDADDDNKDDSDGTTTITDLQPNQ